MPTTRRTLLTAAAATTLPLSRPRAQTAGRVKIKIGSIADHSGPYKDNTGPTGVACARQAVQDFGDHGFDVEVLVADNQNKPDLATSIARQWFDQEGVDMVFDGGASSAALAINAVTREKNKVYLNTVSATTEMTGAQCSPNSVHWVYDTYMLAKSTGGAMVKAGGDSWYFISANYVFGQQLQADTARFVTAAGGAVKGAASYPFPETTDYSAFLLQAKSSGAKVLGLCNSGSDTVNCIKQAREFGLTDKMKIAAMLMYSTDVHAVGLPTAQGLLLTESYYWDLNDRTRAFQARIQPKIVLWPNMCQAGDYSATLHYLKTVADMGPAEAKKNGAATVARMKAMPTDDDVFGPGRIREDGRKIHPSYLFQAKAPSESRHEWDLLKLVATTPAEDAWRSLADGHCALVKA
jgi:branched-chain amino acid transport system substrate-binding protein